MARLTPLSDLVADRSYDFKTDNIYDPTGDTAYGSNGEKVGTVRSALADENGKVRYLLVDVGGWFSSKEVLVPVGMARMEDDAVYFDTLSRDQVKDMTAYQPGQDYDYDTEVADQRVLRGTNYEAPTMANVPDTTTATTGTQTGNRYDYDRDDMFKTPTKLQLLEERLMVDKERYQAGSVQVGKRVETHTENVNVDLQRDEVVIERHAVSDPRPVEGNVTLGADSQTISVQLEAERANVRKQAYVTEEVEVGKRTETERQTVSDTIGREVLEVTKTGDVDVNTGGMTDTTGRTTSTTRDDRGLGEKMSDAVKDAVDPLDGKIDRR